MAERVCGHERQGTGWLLRSSTQNLVQICGNYVVWIGARILVVERLVQFGECTLVEWSLLRALQFIPLMILRRKNDSVGDLKDMPSHMRGGRKNYRVLSQF